MKITRSSKATIKFATQKKRDIINEITDEYSRVANIFIEMFSGNNFQKKDLKKEITAIPESWLSARMRQCCAREAPGMVQGALMSAAAEKKVVAKKERSSRYGSGRVNECGCEGHRTCETCTYRQKDDSFLSVCQN